MRVRCGGPMRIAVRVVSLLVLLCCAVSARQEQKAPAPGAAAEYKIPPEASRITNPVKVTPAALAEGMKLKLLDYRDPASLKEMTDGDLFYIIKNGKGDMTGEGDRSKPDEIWNLVNYVRSMAQKNFTPAKQ